MQKKYKRIILTLIILLVIGMVYLMRCQILYKHSKLVYVGEIRINDVRKMMLEGWFTWCDRDDLYTVLDEYVGKDDGWLDLSQQELDDLIKSVSEYDGYSTVILSQVRTESFWTRRLSPHIGYVDQANTLLDHQLVHDDVLYVYVTKCKDIDITPEDWGLGLPPLGIFSYWR